MYLSSARLSTATGCVLPLILARPLPSRAHGMAWGQLRVPLLRCLALKPNCNDWYTAAKCDRERGGDAGGGGAVGDAGTTLLRLRHATSHIAPVHHTKAGAHHKHLNRQQNGVATGVIRWHSPPA